MVLLGMTALAHAANEQTSPQTPFDQANTEFAQKDFRHAAADYEAIITRQGYSVPVLFNLANAYEQDGKLGLAILNYERAELRTMRTSHSICTLPVPKPGLPIVPRCGSNRRPISSA